MRIPVTLLAQLGLTIDPAPVPEVLGHVVIRELNPANYAADKNAMEPILVALAFAATAGIVSPPVGL